MKQSLTIKMLLVGAMILSFGFQSCSSVKKIDQSKLDGYWQLKTMKGESVNDAFKTHAPSLKFNFADNTISGSGGCNNYSGTFVLTNKNEFSARNPIATMRACLEANKEPQFFAALSTPDMKLLLEDDENTLLFKNGNDIVLEFIKSQESISSKDLVGQWVLSYIAGGDINELFEAKPSLDIAEDGKIIGQGGCNAIRTSYSLNGSTIKFNPIMSTKMACPSLKGEGMFTALLSDTSLQVEVKEGKLSLFKDSTLVLEFDKDTSK